MSPQSPDHLRISLAAAMELGFVQGLFYRGARLHCINLLLTYEAGCKANCSFCGLSRDGQKAYAERKFIRVGWPTKSTDEIIQAIQERQSKGIIQRVCFSQITRLRCQADSLALIEKFHRETEPPISVLIAPTILDRDDLKDMKAAGAERIGVAIDCATPELFDKHRGSGVKGPHKWDRYWDIYGQSLEIFGKDMVGVHLICGVGETERELTGAMDRARRMGGFTHLFSFFPESTSRLGEQTPPPMATYRRIQLARWLIDNDQTSLAKMEFDEAGRIIDFGVSSPILEDALGQGEAFRTSGCPGKTMPSACNRPFANERPGPDIRNFPFAPNEEDKQRCRTQLFEDMPDRANKVDAA